MKTKNKWIVLFLATVFVACEDIIEKDISDDSIQLIFPTNNQEITSNVVNFQWQEIDGADKYRIQVVNNNLGIVLDSLVIQTNLSFPLTQGNYQWRVRGENGAYETNFTFNSNFSVIETSDLTNQQVFLSSPSDGYYTNNTSMVLNWQPITAADSYSFELLKITNGEALVNQQSSITSTSLTLNSSLLQSNAQYRWKIKAVNTTSQTAYYSRTFYLDTNVPNTPINITPNNNSTVGVNQNIPFTWNMSSDYGIIQSSISYTLEFSNTIGFTTIIQSSDVSETQFNQVFTTTGEYYWRVRAKDAAGNIGQASLPYKFTVN